jgi:formamidopyrimidine-DNA glycosylase
MLELPETAVLARQINEELAGKCIEKVTANHSPHKFAWFSGDPASYDGKLLGREIHDSVPLGCEVEVRMGGINLLLGAPLRYHLKGEVRPSKHQLLLEFTDGTALSASVQMWGGLFCYEDGEPVDFIEYHHAAEKPSALSDGFDQAYFESLADEGTAKLPLKAFLATGQRIPGLGNGVLQDILWTARLHPKRRMASLSQEVYGKLYRSVKTVLQQMVDQGGRDTEKDLFGRPGGYRTLLSKNTVGKPCQRCETIIQKEAYQGGAIYFCPVCQEKPAG